MGTARDHEVTKLYNFQPTLDYLEVNLRENHIHCSNPDNFNDPWDCKPYFDPSSLDDPEQRQKWIDFFKAQHADLAPGQQAEILKQLGSEWYENTALLHQSIVKTTENVWKNNAERFRVFCLTTKPTSLLMWAHYANKHRGLCLEFDATAEKVWRARRVVYVDKLPLANADMMTNHAALLEASLLTKSTEWCYEGEYRLLARDGAINPTFSLATEGNFLKLPQDAIRAVIAGARAKIDAIREIVRKVAPGLPVKRAVQRASQYHLDIVE
jgi:hypothetical protein